MGAYGMDDEQLDALRKAMQERLNRLPLKPHQLLPFPRGVKGQDVEVPRNTADATLESFQVRNNRLMVH